MTRAQLLSANRGLREWRLTCTQADYIRHDFYAQAKFIWRLITILTCTRRENIWTGRLELKQPNCEDLIYTKVKRRKNCCIHIIYNFSIIMIRREIIFNSNRVRYRRVTELITTWSFWEFFRVLIKLCFQFFALVLRTNSLLLNKCFVSNYSTSKNQ